MNSSEFNRDAFFQTVKDSVQEMIGIRGMGAVMEASFRNDRQPQVSRIPETAGHEMTAFFSSIEKVYGRLAGLGIQQRCGRTSFEYLFRFPEVDEAFSSMSKKLLPMPVRIRQGLEILSCPVSSQLGMDILTGEDDQSWFWRISACPLCTQVLDPAGSCHYLVGLVQGLTSWMSGGRFFDVREVNRPADRKEACLIRVGKTPME